LKRATKRRQVGGLIAAGLIIGLFAATLALPDSNTDPNTTTTVEADSTTTTVAPTTTVLDPANLSLAGQELYALVTAGRGSTYRVRFELTGSSLPIGATGTTLEIWRSGPQLRQDTTIEDQSGVTHGYNFGGPDGTVSCQQQPGIELTCQQSSTTPFPPENDFLSSIMGLLSEAEIVPRDDTVLDRAARCFLLDEDIEAERAEICLTPEGAPLIVEVPGLRADAVELTMTVDPSDFTPPAPVSGQSTTLSTTIDTVITPDSTAP
jgi:hypothetical protein